MDYFLLSDAELLHKAIFNKNQHAFRELFDRYYQKLIAFSFYFVRSYENAEDVVQEAFLKLLKRDRSSKEIENIKAYLYKTTKNISLDYIRKTKKRGHVQVLEDVQDYQVVEKSFPSLILESKEFQLMIERLIENFPPKRKLIFSLSRDEMMKYAEIAKLLDISQKTVESHMRIALKELKTAIYDYDKAITTSTRKLYSK